MYKNNCYTGDYEKCFETIPNYLLIHFDLIVLVTLTFDPFTSDSGKSKTDKCYKITNWVKLKQHHSKELRNSLPMNGYTLGFCPQNQKLKDFLRLHLRFHSGSQRFNLNFDFLPQFKAEFDSLCPGIYTYSANKPVFCFPKLKAMKL